MEVLREQTLAQTITWILKENLATYLWAKRRQTKCRAWAWRRSLKAEVQWRTSHTLPAIGAFHQTTYDLDEKLQDEVFFGVRRQQPADLRIRFLSGSFKWLWWSKKGRAWCSLGSWELLLFLDDTSLSGEASDFLQLEATLITTVECLCRITTSAHFYRFRFQRQKDIYEFFTLPSRLKRIYLLN